MAIEPEARGVESRLIGMHLSAPDEGEHRQVSLSRGAGPEQAAFVNGIGGHDIELDDTHASSRKIANLRRDPRVAVVVGGGDRDVGQIPVRQWRPALAVPGQAVDGQHGQRPGRAVAVHLKVVGHALDPAISSRRRWLGHSPGLTI